MCPSGRTSRMHCLGAQIMHGDNDNNKNNDDNNDENDDNHDNSNTENMPHSAGPRGCTASGHRLFMDKNDKHKNGNKNETDNNNG